MPGPTRSAPAAAALLVLACAAGLATPPADPPPTSPAEPRTVVLEPVRDATLIESADGSLANGEGAALFVGRTGQPRDSRRRALLLFDVAGALPSGAELLSATLTLTLEHTHAGPEPIELYRVVADWGEGPSKTAGGRGAAALPGDATWLHRSFPDAPWSRPGGDFAAPPSAVAVAAAEGRFTWGPAPEMTADAESWLRRPADNHGWLLLGNEEAAGTAKSFASRESETPESRPRLTLTFRPPSAP